MRWIPTEVERLYDFLGFFDKAYIKLRWRLCPFYLIEKFLPKKGIIIDVGCGYGLLANYLALKHNERNVYGYDLNQRRIKIANKSIKNRGNIHFEAKDVKMLKLNSCDAIVMSDFLHHIPYKEQKNLARQAHNKLKKGGILMIQDIGRKPLWKYYIAIFIDNVVNFFPKLYYFSSSSFKYMLEKNGFIVNVIRADKSLPLPDVLFVCKKV